MPSNPNRWYKNLPLLSRGGRLVWRKRDFPLTPAYDIYTSLVNRRAGEDAQRTQFGASRCLEQERVRIFRPGEPVVYYLRDGPKRGFVREELQVVPWNTELPPEGVLKGFGVNPVG